MEVKLGDYTVEIAETFGPRITGFRRGDGSDLFARLGDLSLPHDEGPYLLRGGHRLWASPEEPEVTYWPDDDPVEIAKEGSVVVAGAGGPFDKSISIGQARDGVLVTHTLRNTSHVPRHAAPWAITQLVPGGTAVLPLGEATDDRQAAATLITWPYTRFDDPGWSVTEATAVIAGTRDDEVKLGSVLDGRTMAYLVGTTAFCKTSGPVSGTVPDRGASGQIYVNNHFVELETVGALAHLEPGDEVTHEERWWILDDVSSVDALVEAIS